MKSFINSLVKDFPFVYLLEAERNVMVGIIGDLRFSNGCVGYALKNMSVSIMSMYTCLVFSNKEAIREYINERIKTLSNIKI